MASLGMQPIEERFEDDAPLTRQAVRRSCQPDVPMAQSRLGFVSALVLALVWSQSGCKKHEPSGAKAETMTRLDAMRGCLISDACGVFSYSYLQHCVDTRYDGAFRASQAAIWAHVFDCVEGAAGDCDQVRRCYGGGGQPPHCSDVTDGFCDGDVQVTCDVIDGRLYRLDCGLAAQQCSMATLPSGDQVPVCGYGPCDQEDDGATCRGNLKLLCDSGYVGVRDCSQDGKLCVGGDCVDAGSVCASRPLCDGQVLQTCENGAKKLTDCAALPGQVACDDQVGACVAVDSLCQDGQETCSGTVARLCHNGIWMDVDCRDLGFAGCVAENGGVHCSR